MYAFVFPGQGAQVVGMGREIYDASSAAREVFEEVSDTLGLNLTRMIFEGPMEDLTLTVNAQPALMTVSLALMRALEKEAGFHLADKASYVAGHSLGEYSALCAAGGYSLKDTAQLLAIRGRAMQEAVPVGTGAMAALLGADLEQAEAITRAAIDGDICEVANDNAPGQVVISGHKSAVERAIEIAKERGIKRALLLPVSAPFHCSLMEPAAVVMQTALSRMSISPLAAPLIANVTADVVADAGEIPVLLVRQVTGRVRWTETVQRLKSLGVTNILEVGAGKVLTGLIKRIEPELTCYALNGPEDIDAFLRLS
ncbi:MAG: ACP S-malonyltransferase [Holosporales bacterium]